MEAAAASNRAADSSSPAALSADASCNMSSSKRRITRTIEPCKSSESSITVCVGARRPHYSKMTSYLEQSLSELQKICKFGALGPCLDNLHQSRTKTVAVFFWTDLHSIVTSSLAYSPAARLLNVRMRRHVSCCYWQGCLCCSLAYLAVASISL